MTTHQNATRLAGEIRKPSLSYHVSEDGDEVMGDLVLSSAFEVTCWERRRGDDHHAAGDLEVYVQGQMRKKDGTPSRQRRSCLVDIDADQPPWLQRIIADAQARLGIP